MAMIARAWQRLLFHEGSARELALFRICFYALSLPYLFLHWRVLAGDFPSALRAPLPALFWLPSVSSAAAPFLYGACALAALASAAGAGVLARFAFFACALAAFGNRYNFGVRLGQVDSPLLVCAFLLLFSRCDDALALPGRSKLKLLFPGEYAWPVLFTRVFFALFFFEAGLAKLRTAGFAWASSDALRTYLQLAHPPGSPAGPPLVSFFLEHPAITLAASWATLLFELASPLSLLSLCAGRAYAVGALLFLVAVRASLGHPFVFSLAPLFAAFLPGRILRYNCSK